jgi:hypothetical protein
MINFLIALINQKYEEVMSKSEITLYDHKAELNREFFINESTQRPEEVGKGEIFVL